MDRLAERRIPRERAIIEAAAWIEHTPGVRSLAPETIANQTDKPRREARLLRCKPEPDRPASMMVNAQVRSKAERRRGTRSSRGAGLGRPSGSSPATIWHDGPQVCQRSGAAVLALMPDDT